MKYEICFLVGEADDANLGEIKERVEGIISKEGGKFYGLEFSEKRKLAYRVGKNVRGTFWARRFEQLEEESNTDFVSKTTKAIGLIPGVLRCLIVRADDLPEIKPKSEPVRTEAPRSAKELSRVPKKEKVSAPKAESGSIDQQLDEILNI